MSCWGTSGKSEFGNLIPAIRDLGERSLNISAVLSFELEESQNVSSGDGCHLGHIWAAGEKAQPREVTFSI